MPKKKVKLTKPKLKKASEKMYKNLYILYEMYEVSGKDLRKKGAPSFVYRPIFNAQSKIMTTIGAIREVIGALS